MFPDEWLNYAPAAVEGVLAEHALGIASATTGWLNAVGTDDGNRPAPELFRIGAGFIPAYPSVAIPAAVPLLDESHLRITTTPDTRAAAEELVETLLLRVVRMYRPGRVVLHVWSTAQMTGMLPKLWPLTRAGLLAVHEPDDLNGLLTGLRRQVKRVHTQVLTDGPPTVKAAVQAGSERQESWHVAVLLGNGTDLPERTQQAVDWVARGGLACGISLIAVDVKLPANVPVQYIKFTGEWVLSSMTGPYLTIKPDPAPPREQALAICSQIADQHEQTRGYTGSFAELTPPAGQWGTASSIDGISAPIGFVDGHPIELSLGDAPAHALIVGPSGTGKTNLILGWIGSLASRYAPSELAFYLVDFKEGVSFAQLTALPHAKLLGINCNTDLEFGLGLLQWLEEEMRRRAKIGTKLKLSKLSDIRREAPDEPLPRIVAVIDEFQYLFTGRDPATKKASTLLVDLARRGRSFGIHLVLASQDITGIDALWNTGVFDQFLLRIALPKARRVLEFDDAAKALQRHKEVIINDEGGVNHANVVARVPRMDAPGTLDQVYQWAQALYPSPPPRLFDGADRPSLRALTHGLTPGTAVFGQRMTVQEKPAAISFYPETGRNLAVLGGLSAGQLLDVATTSLAGHGKIDVLDLAGGATTLDGLKAKLIDLHQLLAERRGGAPYDPYYLAVRAADVALPMLSQDEHGRELAVAWKNLLRYGPELGVHVLSWWRSVPRFREFLRSGGIASDDFGVVVGIDVQGNDFGALLGGVNILLPWSPRVGRALWFDRSRHNEPEVIILPEGVGEEED